MELISLIPKTHTQHDFRAENWTLIFLISCVVSKFSNDQDFCISMIAFEGVLLKSLDSSSTGSKISLSEVFVFGWASVRYFYERGGRWYRGNFSFSL